MSNEIEDGMGFAGLVGETPEEREIERLEKALRKSQKRVAALAVVLTKYMDAYPAFRMKPIGAPGSEKRVEQENLMALEEAAIATLKATP